MVQILSDLEARALPLRTLLEIAEVFRPSADEMIVGYRSGYTDRALPLGENEARRFRHAMALLVAFEGLYRHAFEKALGAPPGDAMRKDLAVALERSMACVVGQMIEHYRARQTVGLASWKRLQQYMQAARQEKLDAVEVADSLHPRGTTTCLATYGRALLLSIAQAGAMTYRSLEATLALTALFAHFVESAMLDTKEGGGRTGPQEGMAGVGIQRTGRIRVVAIGGVTHLVNTTKIDGALNSCIQRLAEGGTPEAIGLAAVAQADLAGLLPRLRRIWCGAGEIREAARQPVHEQSAVAIGFQEIYQFARPGPMTMPKEFQVYTGGSVSEYGRTEQRLESVPNANPVENWQTLDHSVSGMRAQRAQAGAQLRRGQLLAVDFNGMREVFGFALAEVRWLQQFTESDAGGIAAGVRFLSANAQVALARGIGIVPGQYQTVGPVFVLDESELVLPSGWFAAGRTIDLWQKEQVSPVKLTTLRARGADYEIAGFEPLNPRQSGVSLDFTSPVAPSSQPS
jgi:hypothetical protein